VNGFRPDLVTISDEVLAEIRGKLAAAGITAEQPLRPRCGLPDYFAMESRCGWPMHDVTYSHQLAFDGLDGAIVHNLFVLACDAWNAVCGIRLRYVPEFGKANIQAKAGKIDGRSGTLAWSYLPCGSSPSSVMQQLYDTSERWSRDLLRDTICHEIGHAIGLPHGPAGSIMQPYANGIIGGPQKWDIDEAVARYGAAPFPPQDPAPPLPPEGPAPDVAAIVFVNGRPIELVPKR
jgi:hypothetical protein